MAKWRLKGGNPEWHEVMKYREVLKDGTVIEAYTEDCDGDFSNWAVAENGVEVASGSTRRLEEATIAAELVICYGAEE